MAIKLSKINKAYLKKVYAMTLRLQKKFGPEMTSALMAHITGKASFANFFDDDDDVAIATPIARNAKKTKRGRKSR